MGVRQSLMWSVMRIVRDRQIAEDLTQETYIRAKKAMDQAPVEHVEAFLHQTARNLAVDHLRRKGTRSRIEVADADSLAMQHVAEDVLSIEDAIIERQRFGLFAQALSGLPERARTVMILSRVENWPNRRIAEHLGISERTVFSDLKLAMGHCRDAVARYEKP
ncbi:sigma-70 family RNA polymerase sigma factor [Paracoccus kondratievae]|nr:sigma-70 family RNA polymerase sigma factor [Paracoccus kondratievae]